MSLIHDIVDGPKGLLSREALLGVGGVEEGSSGEDQDQGICLLIFRDAQLPIYGAPWQTVDEFLVITMVKDLGDGPENPS
jgi:hypothetical protein